MIIALEGPDGCGKTTLFEALKPLHPDAAFVEKGWDCALVAEPGNLYICDRYHAVCGPVFQMMFNQPTPQWIGPWSRARRQLYRKLRVGLPWVLIVYIDMLPWSLEARGKLTLSDAHRLCNLYESELANWNHVRVNGDAPREMLLNSVSKIVERCYVGQYAVQTPRWAAS